MKKSNKLMISALLASAFVVVNVFSQANGTEISSAERTSNGNVHTVLSQGAVATNKREAKTLVKPNASRLFGSEKLTIIR